MQVGKIVVFADSISLAPAGGIADLPVIMKGKLRLLSGSLTGCAAFFLLHSTAAIRRGEVVIEPEGVHPDDIRIVKPAHKIRHTFAEVYPGTEFEDLCITRVLLHARLDRKPEIEPV